MGMTARDRSIYTSSSSHRGNRALRIYTRCENVIDHTERDGSFLRRTVRIESTLPPPLLLRRTHFHRYYVPNMSQTVLVPRLAVRSDVVLAVRGCISRAVVMLRGRTAILARLHCGGTTATSSQKYRYESITQIARERARQ